jgi:hypothetical protein
VPPGSLIGPLTGPPPWPGGLAAAVLAGALLWVVCARLRLRPPSCAAAVAVFACAVLLVEWYSPDGVDGRGALLLGVAACAAVGGRVRSTVAVLACVAAVAVAPVAAVGFLVLLGWTALHGGLGARWSRGWQQVAAAVAVVAAALVAAAGFAPGAALALPPPALAVLTLWGVLLAGLLHTRLRWLRPVGAALLSLLGCIWVPGVDAAAVVLVAGGGAVLSVVLAEEARSLLTRRLLVAAVASAVAVTALVAPAGVPVEPAHAAVTAAPEPAAAVEPEPEPGPAVRPVAVLIPALGVDGPLAELTADPVTGELAAPDDPSQAGWFAAGVVPGDRGPAVLGGHVDSRAGPGVFADLHTLRPGDLVEVGRSDGTTVRFTVTAVRRHPKDRFPTEAVYGPAPGPELRLVTCGGVFDRSERSYLDNVVVDAVLV